MVGVLAVGLCSLGAPYLAEAQLEAAVVLGTRLEAGSSQRGTLVLPSGEEQPIVLRQQLRVPWLIAGARFAGVIYQSVSLELGYTAGLVKVSIHPFDDDDTELFPSRNGMVHTFAMRPRVELGRFGIAATGHAFAGPVLVWRTGQGFAPYNGSLRGGWSVGLGAMLRTGGLLFRADLEDVIYPLALSQPGVLDIRRTVRHDVLVTLGVSLLHGRVPLTEP
ncbi:MAG TPA: hypothetical protein VHH32_09875 [Gemmatimonadales bacterium]|nr:hypothetical protein [Gemmatimonadales bacterium]